MRDYFTTSFSHIPDIAINIERVWETKLLAMKAHESQVVEANPHADGVLDEVLESEAKRAGVFVLQFLSLQQNHPGY